MTTVNEGQSNVLLKDVLIADTLPGSAAGNSILNPLSSSNKQNIGASSLMVDSKNQLAVEPDKPSVTTDLLKSNHAISESSSKKSDDSLIVPDPLKSSLSGSVTSNTGLDTLSGSQSGAGVKDALTGSSKDTPLIAIKDDTLTATDSLTNNQSAKEISPDKKAGTLVEKETKPETETTKNNLVAEQKDTKTQVATNADKVTGEKPIADASKDSNKQNSIVSTTEAVATSNLPKETTSPTVTNADKLTGEKPVVTAADVSKDSNKENSTATSGDNEKKVADNTQVAAVETPKELSQTAPKSEPVADNQFTSGKFIVDSTGKVGIDFLFDGGLYKGQLAIVSLKGMEKFVPGSAEFIKEVASRALSNSVKGHVVINDLSEGARFTGNLPEGNYNEGTYLGVKTFVMTPGEEFGVMLVPNGTVQELLNNPVVGGDKRPLFSMATANPAEGFYVGQIADVTGSGKTFAMEDLRVDLGSDRDYNDLIFQVRGATGTAVNLDSVINPEKDWRKADIGKALIAYAKPYVEPKVEPAKEDGKPVANTESNSVLDVPISNAKPTVQEDVKPVANSVATKDVAVAETKVTPTEEAKTDPIANSVSPSIKDAADSEPTVTKVVENEPEIKAIAPKIETNSVSVSEPKIEPLEAKQEPIANSVSPSIKDAADSEPTVTKVVENEPEIKAIAPKIETNSVSVSEPKIEPLEAKQEPIANSVSPSIKDAPASEPTVTKAVENEPEIKAIAPKIETNSVSVSEPKIEPLEAKQEPIANPVPPSIKDAVASEPTVTIAVETEPEIKAIAPKIETNSVSVSEPKIEPTEAKQEPIANPVPPSIKDAVASEPTVTIAVETEPEIKAIAPKIETNSVSVSEPKIEPTEAKQEPIANSVPPSIKDAVASEPTVTIAVETEPEIKAIAPKIETNSVSVSEPKIEPTEAKQEPIANSVSPSIKDAVASEPTVTIAVETETEIVSQRVTQPAPQPQGERI